MRQIKNRAWLPEGLQCLQAQFNGGLVHRWALTMDLVPRQVLPYGPSAQVGTASVPSNQVGTAYGPSAQVGTAYGTSGWVGTALGPSAQVGTA